MNTDALNVVNQFGLLPFVGVFFVMPLMGLLTMVWMAFFVLGRAKKELAGSGDFVKETIGEWITEGRQKIEVEIEMKDTLKKLAEHLEKLSEGLWDSRRYIDDMEKRIREEVEENREILRRIYMKMPKRSDDKSDTVTILQERKK